VAKLEPYDKDLLPGDDPGMDSSTAHNILLNTSFHLAQQIERNRQMNISIKISAYSQIRFQITMKVTCFTLASAPLLPGRLIQPITQRKKISFPCGGGTHSAGSVAQLDGLACIH
jgi:hypothetical protein